MEAESPDSPPPRPHTVTVRRNPYRKARPTPSSAVPLRQPQFSPSVVAELPSIRLEEILSNQDSNIEAQTRPITENLKVYLRIRPLVINNGPKPAELKNVWPKAVSKSKPLSKEKGRKNTQICVTVNDDLHSVTVSPPQAIGSKRIKSEVYEGFSHVFSSEVKQNELYAQILRPLVEEFLKGKSGMLAAMGPSGSGKTHTVFGCAREPGMVPLALRHIFSENDGTERKFKLSMFEICSEKGKAERMIDLSENGGDICMQQSILKGLQEVVVCDAQQAESLISLGMLKRATAMTNSNSQSSRSQCIINIRCVPKKFDGEIDEQGSGSNLTIVDLAGAEREKRTGNHGARLLESNFINNTSMVLGLCLRSLFEHQKNPKKPLQKHFQNSLLTRYLRDYLEGKKRMTLILTVKPGEEDYLDTSFLLRQASPFTKIKYKNIEESLNVTCNKRPIQAFPRAEQLKKMKFSGIEHSLTVEENTNGSLPLTAEEVAVKEVNDGTKIGEDIEDCSSEGFGFQSKELAGLEINGRASPRSCIRSAESDGECQIMQENSKALWNTLKQYKKKLEVAEKEISHLRDSLTTEKTRRLDLENELKELKSRCACWKEASAEVSVLHTPNAKTKLSPYQPADCQKLIDQQQGPQESIHYPEDLVIYLDTETGGEHCDIEETSNLTTAHLSSDEGCVEATEQHCSLEVNNTFDHNARRDSRSNGECISVAWYLSTQECESANSHGDCEVPKDLESKEAQSENCTTDNSSISLDRGQTAFDSVLPEFMACSSKSPCKDDRSFSVDEESFQYEEGKLDPFISNHQVRVSNGVFVSCSGGSGEHLDVDLQESNNGVEDVNGSKDIGRKEMHSETDSTCNLTTACLSSGHGVEGTTENCVVQDPNTSDDDGRSDGCSNGECLSVAPCLLNPQECSSVISFGDCKDPKDVKVEQAQPGNCTTYNSSLSLDEVQTASSAVLSGSVDRSPGRALQEDDSLSVDEETFQIKDRKINQPVTILEDSQGGRNVQNVEPSLALCFSSLKEEKKPKRRLLPAANVLLKDISIFDINDESDKPKGSRREKNVAAHDQNRTQGSISLIHLLRNNLSAK